MNELAANGNMMGTPRPAEFLASSHHPGGVILDCVVGNIAFQSDVDAIVTMMSPARPSDDAVLCGPSGVPAVPGQATVMTGQSPFVIQCLGPASAASPAADVVLAGCYRHAIKLASAHRVTSIAFAAISTGPLGYTIEAVARIGCRVIVAELVGDTTIRRVRFVSPRASDARLFWRALSEALVALRASTPPSRPASTRRAG